MVADENHHSQALPQHSGFGFERSVSVIMPAYNVSQYIGTAITSVLNQTFTDHEIIVVNDGSPDTPELEQALAPYRGKIVYLQQNNRGAAAARNLALRTSRGQYIALLDPDDFWEPDYLACQIEIMERDPTIDVLYPNAIFFGDVPYAGKTFMELSPSEGEVTFESLITERCTVMVSVTARREAIIRAGLFDESLRSTEDFDLWLRIAHQGGHIAYHRKPLVHYRRRGGSLSSDPAWMCRHVLKVFDKAEQTLNLTPPERRLLAQQQARFRARLSFHEGKQAFALGDYHTAIDKLSSANAYFRSAKGTLVLMALRIAPKILMRVYNFRQRPRFSGGARANGKA